MTDAVMRPTSVDPTAFLEAVEHPRRREDGKLLRDLFERVSGEAAVMWGPSIVGFGRYHYRYGSGHEGDAPRVGFSPRKANLVLYVGGYQGYDADLARLGKHKRSVACLYLSKLGDVDASVLEEIVRKSWNAPAPSGC